MTEPTDTQPEKLPLLPRKKKFLLPIALLLAVVVLGLGLGLVYAFTSVKRTEPFELTLQALADRPEVRQHVGEPFEPRFIVLGKVDDGDGVADLMFKITGPVGEGTIRSRAERIDGAWAVTYLQLGVGGREDGEVITLVGDPDELPR